MITNLKKKTKNTQAFSHPFDCMILAAYYAGLLSKLLFSFLLSDYYRYLYRDLIFSS